MKAAAGEIQTADGHLVTGLTRSTEKPLLFGMCWKADPRGYGIMGAMRWWPDGKAELYEDDPSLVLVNIPDHLLT